MALEGCIGAVPSLRTRAAIMRFWLWEKVCNGEIDGETWSAESFAIWKEKHSHLPKAAAKRGIAKPLSLPDMKWCYQCDTEKLRSEFSVDRSRGDGLANRCRACAARKWKQANSQTCKKCGGVSIGAVCLRCYRWTAIIQHAELEIISQIPRALKYERKRLLESLDNATRQAYLQAEKLKNMAASMEWR